MLHLNTRLTRPSAGPALAHGADFPHEDGERICFGRSISWRMDRYRRRVQPAPINAKHPAVRAHAAAVDKRTRKAQKRIRQAWIDENRKANQIAKVQLHRSAGGGHFAVAVVLVNTLGYPAIERFVADATSERVSDYVNVWNAPTADALAAFGTIREVATDHPCAGIDVVKKLVAHLKKMGYTDARIEVLT